MKLLYISGYQFTKKEDGFYAPPAFGNQFWLKYLDVFDSIRVLGVEIKKYLDNGALSKITDARIDIEIIPNNTHPKEFINDFKIKRVLRDEIKKADAIIIKPALRKGMMAIKIAEAFNKPYMIDMTGDIHLTLSTNPSILKRMYSSYLYRRIVKTIANAPFGIYVTEKYLQKKYPIKGQIAGITDTVIDEIDENILVKRLENISSKVSDSTYNIGLIGSYHGNRKGIDVAIKAIQKLSNSNAVLNILYNGAEVDRKYWLNYAEQFSVQHQIKFPLPKGSTKDVLEWIDTQDIIILPSRSEGLPRCIVEAMSRACPCITSDVCGLPELINNKWVHSPEDYKKLSMMLNSFITSVDLRKEVAIENFNNSKRFLRSELTKKRNAFFQEFRQYCQDYKDNKNDCKKI